MAKTSLGALLLVLSTRSYAGQSCSQPAVIGPDGSTLEFDYVSPGTSNFYQFDVTANRSYSVQVVQPYDV